MNHDLDNPARALESTKGSLHRSKMSWTLVHKRLKIGPEFLPTVSILFRPQSVAHLPGGTWRSTATLNGIGFVCSSDSKPQKMLSWTCYGVGRP